MAPDMTITEVVAAVLATMAVCAIVWLALEGDAAAKTALTGLVGAASSYFLTPKIAANGKNGQPPGTPTP